jgi:23S rRNA (cytosine1962-C5)-methyltransferase
MNLFTPEHWKDYELLDTGGLEKLERFGKYILTRPEPQAIWKKSLSQEEWEKASHAVYKRTKGLDPGKTENFEKGEWNRKPNMPDQWSIEYHYNGMDLRFRLGLTAFGHVGVFPEQAVNWDFIYDYVSSPPIPLSWEERGQGVRSDGFRVLNLFAYTGGASLAAKAAGAEVIHVDSIKNVVNWAKEDMEASGLNGIRWVVEDALKFARRESKRGKHYQGIILDPPAYGRGPEGEKWILQDRVDELLGYCKQILDPDRHFLILSMYSMGFSSLIARNLVTSHFGNITGDETGELFFADKAGRQLPLGTVVRIKK